MFWKKKKPICNHDWHELETRTETVEEYNGIDFDFDERDFTYTYCPKCDSRRRVDTKEWTLINKSQEIKRKYQSK